jgi:sulfide dehydrogenase cytochrome subunit
MRKAGAADRDAGTIRSNPARARRRRAPERRLSMLRTVPRLTATLAAAALCGAIATPAAAQSPPAELGRNLAATCANCHGTGGVSVGGTVSLAGTPKADLVAKMQDFKAGRRTGTIMPQLAKGYTDPQIEALSAWFAAQKAPQ